MLRRLILLLCLLASAAWAESPPVPQVASGRIERLVLDSPQIGQRTVDVWLPDGYPAKAPYAVLYLQDGQMLFDAGITWNQQEWRADEIAAQLQADGKVRPFIIVGIHNVGGNRHAEYFPQKPYAGLPADFRAGLQTASRPGGAVLFQKPPYSDAYLAFLVEELKPRIDADFATSPAMADTAVLGSSMGGLISLYAISEYPQVFGSAAALSTHWPGIFAVENNPIPQAFFDYMQTSLPDPASHRLYFDYGTATLDAIYPPLQARADEVIRAKGYDAANWRSLRFEGAEHSENAWSERLAIPLQFLFPPQ